MTEFAIFIALLNEKPPSIKSSKSQNMTNFTANYVGFFPILQKMVARFSNKKIQL